MYLITHHVIYDPYCLTYRCCLEPHVAHTSYQVIHCDGTAIKCIKVQLFNFARSRGHLLRGFKDSIRD